MKKLLTLLFALLASVGTLFAESGSYGDNLTWDLSDGVLTINGSGDMTNRSSYSDLPWYSSRKTITSVIIDDGVTSIGMYAFFDCTRLTSITIPSSITSIEKQAFSYCPRLTSITIPNSVISIGVGAFYGCTGLTSMTIPNSVTNIGRSIFSDCSGLTSIVIEKGNSVYDSRENCNAIIETTTNTLISGCKNTIIPNSVTSIGGWAFNGCDGLTSVTIPNSVISIEVGAFYGCTGLTSIEISNSLTSIGESAFCRCNSLTSITIPNSVTSVGREAFSGCSGLTSIIVENGNPVYDNRDNCNAIIETATNTLFAGCQNTTIPNSVTSIGEYAFDGRTGLTSITIPNSVISIGGDAFSGCSSLTSIEIPNSITSIGGDAFYGCSSLTSIEIPNSVTSIGNNAFAYCYGLTSITIPNSVTSIGEWTFSHCGLTAIEISNSITSIGEGAFYGSFGLTSIIIPSSVTSIGGAAFYGCSGLTSVTSEAVTPPTCDGSTVFSGVDKSIPLYVPAESIDAYKAADQWKEFTNILPISGSEVEDTVPTDSVLANYYNTGDVCVCIYVPAEMNCNDIVLTGSFNGWSTNIAECAMFEPVAGYDGWHVTSFTPEEELDAEKGIQAKPIMLDSDGRFNWSYQAGAATVIRGGVQVVANAYSGEIDLHHYSAGTPNVFKIDAWKDNPCTSAYHNYKFTVISDGCEGYVAPFIVGSFTNWTFTQMNYDVDASTKLGADVYSFNIKAAEGSPFQFVSGMWNDEGYVGVQPSWSDDAYIQILGEDGLWRRIHGEEGDNLLTHESAEIVMDIRPDNIRWARCAPAEKAELVIFGVKLPAENCPEAVEVIGTFDDWGGTALDILETGWYIAKFDAKASQYFKFRKAGSWDQELKIYNEENDEWAKIGDNQLVFGQLWQDDTYKGDPCKSIELDLSDPEKYRWSGTSEPTPCLIASGTCGAQGDNLTWELSCDGVLTISGSGNMTNWSYSSNAPWYSFRENITSVIIPNSVTSIGERAFWGCSGLTSIEIPNSVTSIGYAAFFNCTSLTSIEIPNSVTTIGESAFGACNSLVSMIVESGNSIYDSRDNCNAIIETSSNTLIAGCQSTIISNSITCIGKSAFSNCNNLASIEIPNSVTSIRDYAFNICKDLTSIEIPNSVTSIGIFAFYYCTSLTSIEIPNSVTSIGECAFDGCSNLTSFTIPNTLTSIERWTFGSCTSLTSVEIPNSVTSIKGSAFYHCSGLTSVTNYANIPQNIESTVFGGNSYYPAVDKSTCILYVPAESIDLYKAADEWKEFTNILPIPGTEVPEYPVIFLDYNSDVLSEQSVAEGSAAVAPEVPEREGYIFKGWNVDIEHITDRTFVIALYDKEGIEVTYKAEDGETIFTEQADLHIPDAPSVEGKTFAGWLTESVDSESGIVLRATYTLDNPTTDDDVVVIPSSTTAAVIFPYVTGAVTYTLVVRNLFGRVVCKILFNAKGQLLGIAFAPGRNRNEQYAEQTTGFNFTVEGLDPSTTYEYKFIAHDETDDVIETLTGSFTTMAELPTDVESPETDNASAIKVVMNDQVLILRGDKIYTVQGQEVR